MQTACQNDDDQDYGLVNKVNVGDSVPDFSLTDSDGGIISSSSLGGRIYMLNFFDTTCPDCQKEFPVLQRIYDKYKASVMVFNVPRSQSLDEVRHYWNQAGLSMPVYMPCDKELYYRFATRGIPRTYIVDGQGTVQAVYSDSPLADYDTFDATLTQLLKNNALKDNGVADLTVRMRVLASTRSTDEDFFRNEHVISRLELFFFDAKTRKFVTKAVVDKLISEEDPVNASYDITYVAEPVRISVGVYNIFAIANYDHIPDDISDQDEFLNMADGITYQDGIEANIPETGPVMTNRATSLTSIDLVPWANKPYVLALDMERVLAKVQIGVSKSNFELRHDDKKYADINITNYKLVNLNRQYYLFQHKDILSTLGKKPDFLFPDNFGDYSEKSEHYVIDPFFYEKTTSQTDASKFKNYYASWYGAFTTENFASMPVAGSFGFAYILENTSYKTCQKNGYSPGIVFKAAVSPVFVYLYDNKSRTLVEESRAEYWPQTIYLYNYHFYGSIQAINVASGLSLDELETYNDTQLKAYGIKKCNFNMGVYETYYTYWIQHRTNSSESMGPMNYGVVRNNFYKIVVAGVSGIGDSGIVPEILRDNYPNSYVDVAVYE
jgi:peroxiredoxin